MTQKRHRLQNTKVLDQRSSVSLHLCFSVEGHNCEREEAPPAEYQGLSPTLSRDLPLCLDVDAQNYEEEEAPPAE